MIELNPKGEAKFCCLVLHGLGANGRDLLSLAPDAWPRDDVRWLFPDAPKRPITINGGMSMRGWHDVSSFDWSSAEDEKGIRDSAEIVAGLIQDEIERGFSMDQIVLLGFSQGGAMALFSGLRQSSPPRAIVGMSCALPLAPTLEAEAGKGSERIPVFLGAGGADEIVPSKFTQAAANSLACRGNKVDLHTYPSMGHSISPEEIEHVAEFLTSASQLKLARL